MEFSSFVQRSCGFDEAPVGATDIIFGQSPSTLLASSTSLPIPSLPRFFIPSLPNVLCSVTTVCRWCALILYCRSLPLYCTKNVISWPYSVCFVVSAPHSSFSPSHLSLQFMGELTSPLSCSSSTSTANNQRGLCPPQSSTITTPPLPVFLSKAYD